MFSSHASITKDSHITPPSSFAAHPLTPPPTDEKLFAHAPRVIALFKEIRAGRHAKREPWTEFQLSAGEYDEIERQLEQDEDLSGYVKDKIRYDYSTESDCLVVRIPTAVHELFVARIEDAIFSQLKSIRDGLGAAARFAEKVYPARSTEVHFPVHNTASGRISKHEPDASFSHEDAQYPGVVIEVAYSQKKKRLGRLAEDYLLDSDASVRVVVGLDIEYGSRESREATLSVWRSRIFNTDDGVELRVVNEVADEVSTHLIGHLMSLVTNTSHAFRDEGGNSTDHPGIQLQLADFACEELTGDVIHIEGLNVTVSGQDLCQYLAAAEAKLRGQRTLIKHSILPEVKKRKRSETLPETMVSDDEAKYKAEEERAVKRVADHDLNYRDT
ncbi:uncharacterized protein BDR25DRAFT_311908 [Lindgomyces ingoldianus]|uniref:Uncharacterized protein n=1 Tax=Lindgomyces ingoldianus TaxID=673940 RepID=A0ACB6R4F6_9PLEO|nr:uncharacterized protein BDR25DRAFT_311908 [Lindgomyces ingoldianus]KAF2473708.1 hypothetical protein BDR25DRAFT_311908 [Lindgomyces ingoldianus]